jgi:hypothetical protein
MRNGIVGSVREEWPAMLQEADWGLWQCEQTRLREHIRCVASGCLKGDVIYARVGVGECRGGEGKSDSMGDRGCVTVVARVRFIVWSSLVEVDRSLAALSDRAGLCWRAGSRAERSDP